MAETPTSSDDLVSLPALRRTVYSLLSLFFDIASFIVYAAIKGIYLLLGGLIVGLSIAFIYSSTQKPFYETSMVVEYNKLNPQAYGEIITQLNSLAGAGSYAELSRQLVLPLNVAANVISLESKNLGGDRLSIDTTTRNHQLFKIIARLRNPMVAPQLQTSLVQYINDRPLLKTTSEEQKKIYEEKLRQVESDIRKLDTLKTEFNRFLASSKVPATVYNDAINPAEIYQQSINLMYQKESIQKALHIDSSTVSVIDGFKTPNTPIGLTPFNLFTYLGIGGMLIGFLASLMIQTRKRVVRRNPSPHSTGR